jgi:hypothetical protein
VIAWGTLVAIEVSRNRGLEGEFMQTQEVKDEILRVAGSRFIGGNCVLIALALKLMCS